MDFWPRLLFGGFVLFLIIVYSVEIGVKNALIWYEKEKRKNNLGE
jgi:hypothetical protein